MIRMYLLHWMYSYLRISRVFTIDISDSCISWLGFNKKNYIYVWTCASTFMQSINLHRVYAFVYYIRFYELHFLQFGIFWLRFSDSWFEFVYRMIKFWITATNKNGNFQIINENTVTTLSHVSFLSPIPNKVFPLSWMALWYLSQLMQLPNTRNNS